MSIDKLAEFAKDGDKNLDNLDVSKGFLQSEKPERQWFNKLFNLLTTKVNEVVDSIDGLPPFEGGVLADTFVVVDGSLSQRTINKGMESVADLSTINNPKDGLRVYVKSYYEGLNKVGGYFQWSATSTEDADDGVVFGGDAQGRFIRIGRKRTATGFGIDESQSRDDNSSRFVKLIKSNSNCLIDCAASLNHSIVIEGVENCTIEFVKGSGSLIFPDGLLFGTTSLTFKDCEGVEVLSPTITKNDYKENSTEYHITFIGSPMCSVISGTLKGGGILCKPNGNPTTAATRYCENMRVSGCLLINPMYGVNLSNVRNYDVSHNIIINPSLFGMAERADGIKIHTGSGVLVEDRYKTKWSGNGHIIGNIIQMAVGTTDGDDCMDLYDGGYELNITDNTCIGGSKGITIKVEDIAFPGINQKINISNLQCYDQSQIGLRITVEKAVIPSYINVNNVICSSHAGDEGVNLRGYGINASNIIVVSKNNELGTGYLRGIRVVGDGVNLNNFFVEGSKNEGLTVTGVNNSNISSGVVKDCGVIGVAGIGKTGVYVVNSKKINFTNINVQDDNGRLDSAFFVGGTFGEYHLMGCITNASTPINYLTNQSSTTLRAIQASVRETGNSWNPIEMTKTGVTSADENIVLFAYPLVNMPKGKYTFKAVFTAAGDQYGYFSKVFTSDWTGSGLVATNELSSLHEDVKSDSGMQVQVLNSTSTSSVFFTATGVAGSSIKWKVDVTVIKP